MIVGIAGLGITGASLAKAIKLKTSHYVFGYDKNNNINIKAKITKVIDDIAEGDMLKKLDVLFLALPPGETVRYLEFHSRLLSPDVTVIDMCDIKVPICRDGFRIAEQYGFTFIGAHPFAESVKKGFDASNPKFFDGANIVLTPTASAPVLILDKVQRLLRAVGFGNIEISSPREHDRMAAFTSQLTRIISNAYIKSPVAANHYGFSGESYKSISRGAKLDAEMWADILSLNREFVIPELSAMCERLAEYLDALKDDDVNKLKKLLEEGSSLSEYIDGKENNLWK